MVNTNMYKISFLPKELSRLVGGTKCNQEDKELRAQAIGGTDNTDCGMVRWVGVGGHGQY